MGKRYIFEPNDESERTSLFPFFRFPVLAVCRLKFTTTLNFEVAGGRGRPAVKNEVKDVTNDASPSPFYVTLQSASALMMKV